MAQDICKKLRQIEEDIFLLHKSDTKDFGEVRDKVSNVVLHIRMQEGLDDTVKLIREGKPLPVRRIGFNLKKLCDGTNESNSRWQKLQALCFEALMLCIMTFRGIISLPSEDFMWLVNNANRYLEVQGLSSNWIAREQVRGVIGKTPQTASTKWFLESYHEFELRKSRTENTLETGESTIAADESPLPLTLPLTTQAANVILSYLAQGQGNGLTISFPMEQLPHINVPFHICAKMMETYRASS